MHHDLLRYLALLVVVRALWLLASPSHTPPQPESDFNRQSWHARRINDLLQDHTRHQRCYVCRPRTTAGRPPPQTEPGNAGLSVDRGGGSGAERPPPQPAAVAGRAERASEHDPVLPPAAAAAVASCVSATGAASPRPGVTIAPPPTGESARPEGAGESTGAEPQLIRATPGPAAAAAAPSPRLEGEEAERTGAHLTGETSGPPASDPPSAPAGPAGPAAAQQQQQPGHRRTRRGNRPGRKRGSNGWRARDVRGGILIGTINIQSVKPKLLELNHELSKRRYDLLSITESWLKPSTPSRLLSFPGYRLFRADRPDKSGYGGVAVLCRDGVEASVISVPSATGPSSKMEALWLNVRAGRRGQPFVLAVVYRPPRRTSTALEADFETLELQLQHVMLKYPGTKIVINGDLNCNMLADSTDLSKQTLLNFLSAYSMSQVIASPTYTSGSLLDVVIVNDSDVVRKSGVRECDISPHKYVVAALCIPRNRAKPAVVNCRPLKGVNVEELHASLHRADWQAVYREGRCSEQWERFLAIFNPILDRYAPMRRVSVRNPDAPHVSEATRDLMCRRRAARLARRGGDDRGEEYRSINRAVRSAIRRDVREDIGRRIMDQGPTSVYRNVRQVIGSNKGARVIPAVDADALNEYFVGVGPSVAREIAESGTSSETLTCRVPRVGACAFTVSIVDYDTLKKTVGGMRNTSACGIDGLCIRVIKLCFDAIGVPLLNIVNTCLANCDFPVAWKHSLIHPIHKSGPPSNPANFRPISLVPVMAKIVEKIVQRQLYAYLSTNDLLASSQHGFRPRHSTETALISVSDYILSATDRGSLTLLCLIDLSKCFDVIDHSKLLTKLQQYGIDAEWFRSYLTDHTQSVSIPDPVSGRNRLSQPLPNAMGVFQGSALGPLLYTVFANDLSFYAPDAHVVQYADDTQVLVSGSRGDLTELVSRMESCLASLDLWFRGNSLKVNASKTQLMVFGSRQNLRSVPTLEVRFRGESLRPESTARNLGVVFDPTLSWDAHVAHVVNKCFGMLIGLSHIRHHLPQNVVPTIVHGLVLSHVRYCLTVYGNGSDKNHKQLQKVINFCARVIAGRRKFDHISDILNGSDWLTAKQLSDFHTLTLTHRILRSGEPSTLVSLFRRVSSLRDRPTRQDSLFYLPRVRSEAGRRQFAYRAPQLYNSVPERLTTLSTDVFKQNLRRTLK